MENTPYHYALIARAIRYIDQNATRQPTLAEVAAAIGLSEAHFQRVFKQWTGVSPKKYLQYLTLDLARNMLANHHNLLDTALATGLSGPSRLHDLFVRWEAMTPGEYARRGEGLLISHSWFDSPYGDMLVLATDRGICGLGFADKAERAATEVDLFARWPKAGFIAEREKMRPWVEATVTGKGEAKLLLSGTGLQIKVWEALLSIPAGEVSTYSDIATHVGKPKAMRAVGTAVGRNPVSWLIPCHRALRKSGALGGYHWGLPVKRAMLARESAQLDAAAPGLGEVPAI
ncbi:MAG: methylated-DNA--[protein]-cysteine S-methyltransferase [Rhodobacteraceae bacterium]|nr:methylated-DNA--[protein]-cysteine S-methyltransferase [Paracoccaceae bacterium]